jgi:hypothetical protein
LQRRLSRVRRSSLCATGLTPPPHPIAAERNDAFGAIALQIGEGFWRGSH